MRIGHKLIFGFVGVALLIGIVGYLAVHASRKALQKSIGESSVSSAIEALDSIDRNIYNRIEVFQEYSRDLILQKTVLESNQKLEQLDNIEAYVNEKDQEWTSVPQKEITPFMQELIDNRLSKELREKTEFYEEKYGYKVLGEVFVTNKYGANAAQTGKTTDYRQDDEEWWQAAKEDGLYVADVEYDESAEVYSTDIGIRIDDENGNFLGVMKVVLNIEEAISILKEAKATAGYKTTEFKLLTKDGKLIYSTEDFEFFEDVSHKLLSRFHQEEEHLDYFIAEGDKAGEGDELFAHAKSKGYTDYKGLGWILVIEHETEEIFAPVAKLRNTILVISLAVAMLAVVLGFFISTSISGPITRLRDAAAEIGKGNLDVRIETGSNDELGKLAASFKKMVEDLQTTTTSADNLNREIAEREQVEKELEGLLHDMGERNKELNCLFGLSRLIERPQISWEQICREAVNLIPNAYQYPDITCARITFDGIEYKTDNFKKTELSQYAPIEVHGEKAGAVEVYYLEERPKCDEDPFLKEERDLLNAVAEHLGGVAERRQTGEKLELFRSLTDRSNDSIFVIEPKWGRFLDVNDRACASLGYPREELLDMTLKDIDESIKDDSAWQERIKELKQKGDTIVEGRHKHKDGTTFFAETSLKLLSQKKQDYIIAVARDITGRKQAEEATRLAYEKLEKANKELKEMQSQMVQSEKLASIGQLAAGVAHEMNTPVGFVASNFQTLEDYIKKIQSVLEMEDELIGKIKTEQKTELLKKADAISKSRDDMKMDFILEDIQGLFDDSREGLDRVTNIIQNLRDFSRIDQPGSLDEYNLNDGIEATLVVAGNEIKYDADVKTEFSELPPVLCDSSQINQVFLNILINAAQAIKSQERDDKGTITIRTYAKDKNVVCEIADDGCGIPPDKISKVFDPFFTTKAVGKGTGLGLSVSYDIIVNKHKGELLVDSTVGKGTKFTIKLPVKTKEQNGGKEIKDGGKKDSVICGR